jgi:peptidoglycan/LPS O-acetylase OafA/YrhL
VAHTLQRNQARRLFSLAAGVKRTYHTLDGFRGLAAICVVLYHSANGASALASNGELAPDLFFVLSGFVIAHAYKDRLLSGMSVGTFMKARFIRLYPLYAIGFLIAALALLIRQPMVSAHSEAETYVRAALFIPGGDVAGDAVQKLYPLNPPAWSLLYEIVVNAGFALLVIACTRGTAMGGWNLVPGHVLIGMLRVAFSFGLGCILYECRKSMVVRLPVSLLLAASIIPFIVQAPPTARLALEVVCLFVLFPTLVALGSASSPGPYLVKACAWLGAISYGVYIIHFPLLIVAQSLLPRSGLLWDAVFSAGVVAMAWVLDSHCDRPLRKYLARQKSQKARDQIA